MRVRDTICRQVSNRDKALRYFAQQFDKILFVAGRSSSNGKILYNICKQTNPHSYFVSSVKDIQAKWFSKNDTVGISGATSTPQWLMQNTKKKLLQL